MVIDFHTHVFPDKIAERTVSLLEKNGGTPSYSDGTARGLAEKLKEGGADIAVNLPVLTSPTQFDSITRFAIGLNDAFRKRECPIISFAGIHPACEDIEGKMRLIKESGFVGVKVHPDYQGTYITDESYVRVLECARDLDLVVVTHSGVDGAFRDCPVRCTPELALQLIHRVPHSKLVLAHLGANEMVEQVLNTLAGEDVYFDTAYVLRKTSRETFMHMIERHGEDRILFASDSPWSSIAYDIAKIKSFSLRKETEDKILYKNAKALLGI